MEDTTLRRFQGCLNRLRYLLLNWLEDTRREIRREPYPKYGLSAEVQGDYDEEASQDLFLPAFSVVRLQGDGYDCTFENTSGYDKSLYLTIRHRAEHVQWTNPPPLYDEGATDE